MSNFSRSVQRRKALRAGKEMPSPAEMDANWYFSLSGGGQRAAYENLSDEAKKIVKERLGGG